MADKKVSAFTPIVAVDGTETVPVLQAGANSRILLSAIKTSYLDTLYQPLDADLTAIAGLVSAANKIPYFTGAGTASVADFTAAGRALVDDASAAAQCTTLGVGTTDTPVFAGQVIEAASPVLTFKDSDCDDADANATITVAATATGTGAEDIDVTFAQQIAGAPTNFLVSDANGLITLGDGTRRIALSGKLDGDVTIYDATPVLTLIDSDSVDKDAGISITAACTTTTAGAEHVDATFTQQVAGSPVNFLVADADGSITLGDGTRPLVLSGTVGDITIKDATPMLVFKDSDATAGDDNFDITVAATDAGNGTEDIDVTFSAQVAGNRVGFLNFDADGNLALGYNGQAVHCAKLVYGVPVTPVTVTVSPTSVNSNTIYTNTGDGDGAAILLPAAVVGLEFTAAVCAAQTLTITADGTDTIRMAASVTAGGGSISSNVVGSVATLACVEAGKWFTKSSVGTWTI